MATAEELIVALRSEGADETVDDLERVEDSTADVTDELETQSDEMQGFATKFRGAMGAVVAGLAVAAGGILTQVPIIGETVGALGAVLNALALKIDSQLRPVLEDVNEDLFGIADAILDDEGGVLSALDKLATASAELTLDSIEFAVEDDVIGDLTSDIIQFVFPKIGEEELLNAVINVDLSAGAVVAALVGGTSIAASKVLSIVLGSLGVTGSVSATTLLGFFLPVIGTAAVLGHVFDINVTKTAILGAIFGGVIIAGAAIVGAISWPVIVGAAIVGTLFAGVVVGGMDVINAIDWPTIGPDLILDAIGVDRNLARESQVSNPAGFRSGGFNQDGDFVGRSTPLANSSNGGGGGGGIIMDGRRLVEETGRYGKDVLNRRGIGR